MARARLLKPGFFSNDKLAELPAHGRLLFAGLWTLADREGRLHDRPKWIKGVLFPYENPPVERLLTMLADAGFILRYEVDSERYIQVTGFQKHQHVHVNEQPSTIPAPDEHRAALPNGETNPSVTTSTSTSTSTSEAEAREPDRTAPTAAKAEIKSAFENRVGFVPPSLQAEFNEYVRFTPKDWFLSAIEVTATEAEQPCWAFCKKVIDNAMSRNTPPGPKVAAGAPSLASIMERRVTRSARR